VQDRDIVTMDG